MSQKTYNGIPRSLCTASFSYINWTIPFSKSYSWWFNSEKPNKKRNKTYCKRVRILLSFSSFSVTEEEVMNGLIVSPACCWCCCTLLCDLVFACFCVAMLRDELIKLNYIFFRLLFVTYVRMWGNNANFTERKWISKSSLNALCT